MKITIVSSKDVVIAFFLVFKEVDNIIHDPLNPSHRYCHLLRRADSYPLAFFKNPLFGPRKLGSMSQ
jgi:hypothetical protein